MPWGKPGILVITDDAGTWTAGDLKVVLQKGATSSLYTQAFTTDKDTSMTALAAQLAADSLVDTAAYSSGDHTITITPFIGKQVGCYVVTHEITGTMQCAAATTQKFPTWAIDGAALLAEPSDPKKEAGWLVSERPPAHWFNFVLNLLYGWIRWVDDMFGECGWGYFDMDVYNNTPALDTTVYWEKRGRHVTLMFNAIPTISISTGNFFIGYTKKLPAFLRPSADQPAWGVVVVDDDATPDTWYCMVLIKSSGIITIFRGTEEFWTATKPTSLARNTVMYALP